ncbi:2Fe-2S iron-sulfur cluster binding domain-containing protein [Rudanella paleaurantiibacter]|uniref:2Fe-2S iron-sulfur cluster binding domain-containing protein n=1 Tax=Rudanella paleaurantiibacter TaxID=2614655 RepID=A0A7J5TTM8_9BACT|nr:ferredoxin--NADP reductase [Rudanella paleaurantiibacter]KAB7727110.1 2Fe-2S iron-sulfur cluster binding domain-containing protein [Rudanella paleaurantiibacter]
MANRFFLKVKDVIRETPDAVTIQFWHPISQEVRYQPGQFLTFLLNINNQKVRRSYSMSSSPHVDVSLAVTIKRLPGGLVSNYLCDRIRKDDVLETLEPMGTFVPQLDSTNRRTVVLIGAGSGITPLFSMAKSILHSEPHSRVWLIYGNRNQESIIFKAHLDAMEQAYGSARFHTTHVLSQPTYGYTGTEGRLNSHTIIKLLEELPQSERDNAHVYLCGPDGMMDEARKALSLVGIPTDRVHKESYATATTESAVGEVEEDPAAAESAEGEVTILYEGSEYKFAVAPHQTILEAALEQDIDLPYSCQAGMCTACLGKCVSGQVKLDEEDALSDSELKAGYILTCVAHPVGKDVVIEID